MIDNSVMKPICRRCLQEMDEDDIKQLQEINCDLCICLDCLELEAYGFYDGNFHDR